MANTISIILLIIFVLKLTSTLTTQETPGGLAEDKDWYVSQDGSDDSNCGILGKPCRNLAYVLNRTAGNCSVFVDGLGNNNSFYPLCSEVQFSWPPSSVRIIGFNGEPNIGCPENKRGNTVAIFSPLHTAHVLKVELEGINIHNGVIWTSNCSLRIHRVKLVNSSIVSLEECLFYQLTITESAIFGGQACHSANRCIEFQTIKLNCSDTMVKIDSSEFYQHLLRVNATTRANITVFNSLFSNIPSQLRALGGLHFTFSSNDSHVIIENSTFEHQINAYRVESVTNLFDCALWVKALEHEANSSTALIRNCKFINNERGFTAVGLFREIALVDCEFSQNIAMHAGAAVLVLISRYSWIHVVNCIFAENAAGTFRRDYPIDEREGDFTEIGSEVVLNAECCTGIITLVGKGGAIRIQRGNVALLNSKFVNNTAKLLGGSIFIDIDGYLYVQNTTFINTDTHNHSLQGDIIYSDGNVNISNVNFVVRTARNGLSILRHSGDHWSVELGNVWIQCPVGYNLRATNASAYGVEDQGLMRSHQLDQLSYFCESCPRNKYSLDYGYLNYTMKFYRHAYYTLLINGSKPNPEYTGSYTQHEIQCDDCPYGGHCVQGITSVANFWGYARQSAAAGFKQVMQFQYCPKSYCCTTPVCPSYNTCVDLRHGRLCGRCKDGFSEALFSAECIQNEKCGPIWLIPFAMGLGLLYALFLMFQVDIKNFLFSKPLFSRARKHVPGNLTKPFMNGNGVVLAALQEFEDAVSSENGGPSELSVTDAAKENVSQKSQKVQEKINEERKKPEFKASDSGFLIILFYYFQDALLMNVKTVYVSNENGTVDLVKAILSGLFKFHLNIFELVGQVCAAPNMTPVPKLLTKALDVPYVICVFVIVYTLYRSGFVMCGAQNTRRRVSMDYSIPKKRSFIVRLSSGFILALLFTFQKMGTTTFTLLNCVPVEGKQVLFVDGWVECYQPWQYGVIGYAITCVTPFFVVLLIGPTMLYQRDISLVQFFLACLCPLPFLFYWAFVKLKRLVKNEKSPTSLLKCRLPESTRAVIQVLQGPFKDNKFGVCWAGVLIGRRLILVLLFTFVNDSLIRLLVTLLFCFLILLHHVHVQPYKDRRGNAAGTTSAAALVCLGTINLVRAGFEAAEYRPTGPNAFLMTVFEEIENTLLLWIPLFVLSIMGLLFLYRVFACIISCCACAQQRRADFQVQEKEVCISLQEIDKQ